jgi:hypothetical protein
MFLILILIGFLIIVNMIENALFQRKQDKTQPPPHPHYGFDVDNLYYQGPLPYRNKDFLQKNTSKEEEDSKRRKKQSQQGVFYTLLFVLGLIALLLYFHN